VRLRAVHRLAWILAVLAPAAASAAEGAPPPAAAANVADLDLDELVKVRVSPFDVSTGLDLGYRASNSVSASRFDARIRDLPFAIQAFTESFIEDQRPVNLFDVARYSPGVTYRSNDFNEGNANLAIRGFTVSTYPAGVQVLRDGFAGPPILDFTNVSRVEVVKGPSSFLYGQVAPGGVVNVITKRPQPRLAATAEATTGSYGQYRFEGDVNAPLARTLFARVAGSWDQDIGYWKPYDAHSWDVAPALRWEPDRRVAVSASYERFHKLETPQVMPKPGLTAQAGVVPTPGDPNRFGVDFPGLPDTWNSMSYSDFRRSDTSALSSWVDVNAGDHWNLRAGYSHLESTIDAVFSGNFGMANNTTTLQGRRFRRATYVNRSDTGEVQAVGTYRLAPVSVRLLLGAQLMARRFDNRSAQAPNDPALGTNPTATPLPYWDLTDPSTWNRNVPIPLSALTASRVDQATRFTDQSVYGGTTIGVLGDRALLLAGVRQTWTESALTDNLTGRGQPRITASAATPQYGILFKAMPELSVYASYAQSFVPGSGLLNNVDGTTSAPVPTRGQGWDLGVKTDLAGGRFSGTLTFFEINNRHVVNDLAILDPATGFQRIYNIQSGEQRSRGVEVDATIAPSERWQVYLSYSYVDARITEFSGNDAAILAQDPSTLDTAARTNYKNVRAFHGARMQMSAPHLANLWTRYAFGQGVLEGIHLGGGANWVYQQTVFPNGPASDRQTYTLVNALVGWSHTWRPVRVCVEATGKNLAGERYRPSQSTRARPREVLLTLTARY
jgi:iron complex outermembrane receptor protein